MFDKDNAIKVLIEDDINSYVEHGWVDTLWFVLESGFKGYSNFNDGELIQELKERGLEEGFGI